MSNAASPVDVDKHLNALSRAIRFLSISLLLMVAGYVLMYATVGINSPLAFFVVPLVLAFWASVIRITWVAYGRVMGVVAALSILIPPALFVLMIMSYARASGFIKAKGKKLTLTGALVES